MKRIAVVLVAMLATCAAYAENPDKVPSIGVDFTQSKLNLTTGLQSFYDSTDNTITYTQENSDLIVKQLTIDARLPVSDYVTFNIHGGPNTAEFFGVTNNGYSIGAGARFYMPASWSMLGGDPNRPRSHR